MKYIAILLATASLAFGGWSNVVFNTDTLAVKPPSFTNLFTAGGSTSVGATNWSLYPAKQTVEFAGFSITNVNKADITEASIENMIVVYEPSNYYPTAQTLEEHLKAIDLQIGIIQSYLATEANKPTIKIYPTSWTTNSFIVDNVNANNPTNTRFWVRNDGTNIMNWNAATNQTWMMLNTASGTSTGESDLVAGIFKGGLSSVTGVYSGSIIISCTNAVNTPQTVPITWNKQRGQMANYSNSVAWYTFDSSARMSNDVSPKAQARHHGVVNGLAAYYDHGLQINSKDDYIVSTGWNNLEANASSATYGLWFCFDERTNANHVYMMNCDTAGDYIETYYSGITYDPNLYGGGPGFVFSINSTSSYTSIGSSCGWWSTNALATTGVWHRVVATYSLGPRGETYVLSPGDSTMRLWFDGALVGISTNAKNFRINQKTPWKAGDIKLNPLQATSGFIGRIDDVLILKNTEWGTAQVTNDYQRGRTDP